MDAETAAEMLDRVLEVMVAAIKRYGGTVRQLLGDGVLAYFGTPMAHENDPERAILAALEIREGMRALGLASTAGINSGEVYVGAVGSEAHTESSAVGTPVNIAARLQAKALPGEVLVGRSTHAHARDAFVFMARDLEAKGFDQSLKAYEVVAPQKRPEAAKGIPGLRAKISGRARELARLESALHELVGGRGSVISLEGEAGVGKSRLIEEFRALARHQRVEIMWVEGHCFDLGHTVSYSCFLDLFRDLLGFANAEGTDTRAELVSTLVSELVSARRIPPDRAGEIEAVLAELLSARVAEAPPWLARTDALRLKEITFLAVREVLQALALNRPLVVALEDMHWADSLSIALVSSLFEVVRLAPVLLLYSYRGDPDNEADELPAQAEAACPGRHARLALRHLTSEESASLISSLLSHSADLGPLIDLIFERAQGNPFFIEEIVRSLIDSGELVKDGGMWRTRGGELPSIPESVQNVIRSRVDRITPEAREVLRVASVVGRDFDARLIERVMGIEGRLPELLDQLEQRALIDRSGSGPGYGYSFRHALTQATVYGSMLRRRRTVVHKQVGEAMEVIYDELEAKYEELAHHFVAAGVTDKAVD
jgi:predicted ATPase